MDKNSAEYVAITLIGLALAFLAVIGGWHLAALMSGSTGCLL